MASITAIFEHQNSGQFCFQSQLEQFLSKNIALNLKRRSRVWQTTPVQSKHQTLFAVHWWFGLPSLPNLVQIYLNILGICAIRQIFFKPNLLPNLTVISVWIKRPKNLLILFEVSETGVVAWTDEGDLRRSRKLKDHAKLNIGINEKHGNNNGLFINQLYLLLPKYCRRKKPECLSNVERCYKNFIIYTSNTRSCEK